MAYRPAGAENYHSDMRGLRMLMVSVLMFTGLVSAPGRAPVVHAAGPRVVINEIYYHAPDDNPANDYIELLNPGTVAVALTGWCFSGVDFCFSPGANLTPGAITVIAAGMFGGSLSNGGERLRLLDQTGAVVDQVTYDDAGLWPAVADGEGLSLERRDPAELGDDPGNWSPAFPSRGLPNSTRSAGLLPYFRDVQHTVLPAPGAPISVSAELVRGSSARLYYRVGFGPEIALVMRPIGGGRIGVSIPGQAAGALVRYRLLDTTRPDSAKRLEQRKPLVTWPRSGDGANYTGTTVATSVTSKLPRFEWFMDDATYTAAFNDLTLSGDDGYPAVLAYGGQIFDNTKVRVKGQVSRYFPKKKWKFILPMGHELAIPGLLPEPVDEFAMHSNWTDKSFLRETLSAEMMEMAGVPTSQAFPVRLERNGAFYGLYTYVEQQDGTWRERMGFSDDHLVYEVGGGTQFGLLMASDANISQGALRMKYDKETREWENDAALRNLIATTNSLTGLSERRWIYANVDVPSVVNALAASIVLQHHDWGHKNYRLVFTPQGKWQVVPTDFDLTLGRKATISAGPYTDTIAVKDPFEHPGTPLFNPFWFDPELASLVDRRVRTLSEELLNPNWIDARIAELNNLVREEAAWDRAVWGIWGEYQVAETAGAEINGSYVAPRRKQIQGTFAQNGRVASTPRVAFPTVKIGGVNAAPVGSTPEFLTIRNDSATSVDLSGFRVDAVGLTVPGGTVLLPGVTAVFVSDKAGSVTSQFGCCLFGGVYSGGIADAGELLVLTNPDGDEVHRFQHGPAPAPPPLFDVVINEVAAVGSAAFVDEASEQEPWFELYNRAPTTATLTGVQFEGANGATWTVPAGVTLPPGGHLLVVADGETGGTHRHAPALLAATGGTLVMKTAAGAVVDTFVYTAAPFGRTPSGAALAEDVLTATPGASNPLPRPRVVLNELNGVADNKTLKSGGSDVFWGQVLGNGGDWVELVVVTDHVDLRGWRLDVVDNGGAPQPVTLPNDAGLADVRAGTIVTVAENPLAPTNYSYDADAGDIWINVNIPGFNVSNDNSQVTIIDAGGRTVFGPAGEGAHPLVGNGGLGSDEVLRLDVSPAFTTLAPGPYIDNVASTFGAPNTITGGAQDLAPLRDTSRPGTPRLLGFDGLAPVISWDPPVGALASQYVVKRNGVQVGTTAGTGYRDTTAPNGQVVQYTVEAQLTVGGTSAPSAALSVTVPDNSPPVMTGTITPWTGSGNTYKFYWNFATDNVAVASYRIYVNGRLAAVTNGATNWVELTKLPDPVPVYLEVYAVDSAGQRSVAAATGVRVTGDGTPAAPPRSVSSSSTRNTVTVRWGFAYDVSGIASYRVTQLNGGPVINTANASATFSGLAPGTIYAYWVQAIDRAGNLGSPAVVIVATKP